MNQGNWGVYLMGWVDQLATPVGLKDANFKTIDTMLYVDSLSPSIKTVSGSLSPSIQAAPGELFLPTSLLVWESSTSNSSPYYMPEIPAGGCVLRFQPAFPISFHAVKSMDFTLITSAPYQDIVVSAWDYERKTWIHLPVAGSTRISEPDRYIGPDGEVRIKIVSNRSDRVEINGSNISLVVEP
jgi:hypothetical protein